MKQITIPHRVYLSIIQAATLKGPVTTKAKKKDEIEYLIDARYGIVIGRNAKGEYFIRNEKENDKPDPKPKEEPNNGKNPK